METYVVIAIRDGTPASVVFAHLLKTVQLGLPVIALIDEHEIRIHVPAEGLRTSLKALRAATNAVSDNEITVMDVYFDTGEKVVYELA